MLGTAAEHGPSGWALVTHVGDTEGAPGSWLSSGHCGQLERKPADWKLSLIKVPLQETYKFLEVK